MDVSNLQIVSNISVFIVFGILTGTILAPWIIYTNSKQHIEDNVSHANVMLSTTWYLALFYVIGIFYLFLTNETSVLIGLTPIGMMIAALIASASVMKNIAETKANEAEKHRKESSKFHLDQCSEGLKTFYELINDGNNSRVIWIEASRTILTVLNLSEKITEPHHKDFFELEKSKYRHKLYALYEKIFDGYEDQGYMFFTGEKDWAFTHDTIDDLVNNPYGIDYLDPDTVIAVFSFLDYPEDYNDPLDNQVDFLSFNKRWPAAPQKYAARYIKYFQKQRG